MANIRVDVDYQIVDGQPLTFKAPCPCSAVDGLTVYYAIGQGQTLSKSFTFKDAHGNDLTDVNNLFDVNAYVKVILNIRDNFAYIQNADTNTYLEGKFEAIEGKIQELQPVRRTLTSVDDLNNLTETGVYTYYTSSIPKNCPYDNAGTIEVIGTGLSSGTKQVVTRYGTSGETRFRIQYEGNWQDWERYTVAKDLTNLGFDSTLISNISKTYSSIEKNGLRYKTAYMSGNAFPNGVFLIALNSESSGGSSLYLVVLGATLESAPAITRLSTIYDNTPYPCVEVSQSGYLYTVWSAAKTADIRVNMFKLA